MNFPKSHTDLAGWCILFCLIFSSCATYNNQVSAYYEYLSRGHYDKAGDALDKNKLLSKDRNRLLYVLEKGKVCHLLGQWDSSNNYFNEADLLIEDARTSAKDIALSNLVNPMMQTYRAEDFEKYLVYYYKALNYLHVGKTNEALVEARRISLRAYAQEDKAGKNKYDNDAFSFMMQAFIYEADGDHNNAFIAYRNAADIFLENNQTYYGIQMPLQLKKDLLRSAVDNGFTGEQQKYERLLAMPAPAITKPAGGELILFWENGLAPVKEQQELWFSLVKGAGGGFFFNDASGRFTGIPFILPDNFSQSSTSLTDLRSFRVALPRYREQQTIYSNGIVQLNSKSYVVEPVESVNTLAFATLQERMLKELAGILARLAIKKLAEAAIRPSQKKDGKEEKDNKSDGGREALALGLQLYSFISEKADTRNWQSLPHTIFYTRIPLAKGTNKITLNLFGRQQKTVSLSVEGKGGLQFRSIGSL